VNGEKGSKKKGAKAQSRKGEQGSGAGDQEKQESEITNSLQSIYFRPFVSSLEPLTP
jgi:hypothetical protein